MRPMAPRDIARRGGGPGSRVPIERIRSVQRFIIITVAVGVVMAVFMCLVPRDSQAPKPTPVTVVAAPQPAPVPTLQPAPQPAPAPRPDWTPPPTQADTPLPDVDAPNINWPNHVDRPKFCKRHWYC